MGVESRGKVVIVLESTGNWIKGSSGSREWVVVVWVVLVLVIIMTHCHIYLPLPMPSTAISIINIILITLTITKTLQPRERLYQCGRARNLIPSQCGHSR